MESFELRHDSSDAQGLKDLVSLLLTSEFESTLEYIAIMIRLSQPESLIEQWTDGPLADLLGTYELTQ